MFNEYKNGYEEKDRKYATVIMMLIGYIILPFLILFVFKQFSCPFIFSLILMGPAISYFFVLIFNNSKKTPNISLLVLILWLITLIASCFYDVEFTILEVFTIYLFFYSLFYVSIIHFEYKNFKDESLDEANRTIQSILNKHDVKETKEIYEMIILSSSRIEDDLVSDIKEALYLFLPFVLVAWNSFISKKIKPYIDVLLLDSALNIHTIIIIILFLGFIIEGCSIFYLLYRSFNWKADLYKSILRDRKFTLALKGEIN